MDEVEIKLTKYVSFYLQNCIIGNLKDSLYVEVSAINHLVIFKLSVAVRQKNPIQLKSYVLCKDPNK